MNNINRLITLWMGECPHDLKKDGVDGWTCIHCNRYFPYPTPNPDFSQPDHFARFTGRLFEQEKMWEAFHEYAEFNYGQQMYRLQFDTWLLSPDDQLHYTRFVTLFAEFLRLPETRREFGWEECPNFNPNPRDINCLNWNESCHCRNSKVLSEWAREVNNA